MSNNLTASEAQRFQELKAKGFVKLSGEEKKEYQKLLALEKGEDEKAGSVEAKTITMTEDQLKAMIASEVAKYKETQIANDSEGLEEAKRLGKWIKAQQPRKMNRTATMRLYREDGLSEPGLIVDWKFIKNIENVDTRKMDVPLYQITVLYDNGDRKNYEIELGKLAEINDPEIVEIIDQKVEAQTMKQGEGRRPYTEGGYSYANPAFFGTKAKVGAGEPFEYIVTRKDIVCTIKRSNGQVLTIHSDRLNQ